MPRTNIRRMRPTEVALVVKMLEHDHDDVEQLAKNILGAINRKRAEEPLFVRVVKDGTGYLFYGPYASADSARLDNASTGTGLGGLMRVYSLIPPFGQPINELEDERREI